MAKHSTEWFGHFFYSPELSYEELLEYEAGLKETVQVILEGEHAEFIHFEAEGDSLLAQCVFSDFTEDLFHRVCDSLAQHIKNTVECKILCVDKTLASLLVYSIRENAWQESGLDLPSGPIEVSLRNNAD